ncbi:MAG TPA: hypothetical protein VNT79_02225 [Phycisphaerae bacterium]|nr:hypothetical protein [Phycisphaerae bacterium]
MSHLDGTPCPIQQPAGAAEMLDAERKKQERRRTRELARRCFTFRRPEFLWLHEAWSSEPGFASGNAAGQDGGTGAHSTANAD